MHSRQKIKKMIFKSEFSKRKRKFSLVILFSIIFLYLFYIYVWTNDRLNILELKSKYRYIQFECTDQEACGGWGDRLKGLLSTYAYSLLTNRKFLIKMTKNCELSDLMEPNEIDWDYKQIAHLWFLRIKNFFILWNFDYFDNLNEVNIIKDYESFDLINVRSGIMYSDMFGTNTFLKSRLKELGYDPGKFLIVYQMKNWYTKLFRLKKNSEKIYQEYLKRLKPTKKSKLICTQIRMGESDHLSKMSESEPKKFWKFINEKFLSGSDSGEYKIFVTSDKEYVKSEAKNFFTKNEVIFLANSSFHIEKEIKYLESKKKECAAMENILLDFHIMQNCDIGVVSHSGFGILGMWNRDEPFKDLYVYTQKDQTLLEIDYWNRNDMHFVKYERLSDIVFT